MSIQKVMKILDEFETQAADHIKRDRALDIDAYESVGRHILVMQIKRKIRGQIDLDDKEAA